MGHPRRDHQHLARTHDDVRDVTGELHPEAALEDVRDLFVRVLVHRDDAALLEVDVRQHRLLASDKATPDLVDELLAWDVLPAME